MKPRTMGTLLARGCASARVEREFQRWFLEHVARVKQAVPVRELEAVLVGIGSGAPLSLLEEALGQFRVASASTGTLTEILEKSMVSQLKPVCIPEAAVTEDEGWTVKRWRFDKNVPAAARAHLKQVFENLRHYVPGVDVKLTRLDVEFTQFVKGSQSGRATGLSHGMERWIQISYDPRYRPLGPAPLRTGKTAWTVDKSSSGTLRHEVGHAVSKSLMGYHRLPDLAVSASKVKIRNAWRAAVQRSSNVVVSEYSTKSAEELFAECFSAYTHPDHVDQLPSEILNFMRKYLGGTP